MSANNSDIVLERVFPELTRGSEYHAQTFLGYGAYASVCSATEKSTGKEVAVKKIFRWSENPQEAQRTLREVKLLNHFQGSPHLLQIEKAFTTNDQEHLMIVTEKMDTDLDSVLLEGPLSVEDRRWIFYNIISGICQLHSAKVIHRDLRPKNILLSNDKSKVIIADFGMGRSLNEDENIRMSMLHYTTSTYYCPPEGLLRCSKYDCSVDIWSAGCILAEMIIRNPIFKQKTKREDQLSFLMRVCERGEVSENSLSISEEYFQALNRVSEQLQSNEPHKTLRKVLPSATKEELSLLRRIFRLNPKHRISAHQILQHPYFAPINNPIPKPFASFEYNDTDFWKCEKAELREKMEQEISNLSKRNNKSY